MLPKDLVPDDHAVIAAAFDAVGSDPGWEQFLRVWAAKCGSPFAQITAVTLNPSNVLSWQSMPAR